jgi:hypothetical protein
VSGVANDHDAPCMLPRSHFDHHQRRGGIASELGWQVRDKLHQLREVALKEGEDRIVWVCVQVV